MRYYKEYEPSHAWRNLTDKYKSALTVDQVARIEQLKKRRKEFSDMSRQEQMLYMRNSIITYLIKEYGYETEQHIPPDIIERVDAFIHRERTTIITVGEKKKTLLPDPEHKFEEYTDIIDDLYHNDKVDAAAYNVLWNIGSFFYHIIHSASPEEILIEAQELGISQENLWESAQSQVDGINHIDVGYLIGATKSDNPHDKTYFSGEQENRSR
jgi:hypothetical protein